MIYKTIKTAAELPFKGIELVKVDKTITEVIIGGKLRIVVSDTYGEKLKLLVEAPYETATRYRMTATLDGFDPKVSYHEYEHDATTASRDLESKGATIAIEKVEVSINDAGEVVEEKSVDGIPVGDTSNDLPF